jgi:hypothetical protein
MLLRMKKTPDYICNEGRTLLIIIHLFFYLQTPRKGKYVKMCLMEEKENLRGYETSEMAYWKDSIVVQSNLSLAVTQGDQTFVTV